MRKITKKRESGIKNQQKELAKKRPISKMLAHAILIDRTEIFVELRRFSNVPVMIHPLGHYRSDYTDLVGIDFTLKSFRDPRKSKKEEIKPRIKQELANFRTYKEYWAGVIENYNQNQDVLHRAGKIKKPKKIDPETALGIVFSPEHQIENALEEISRQIKALGQSDTLDLDKLKNLIDRANSLILSHGDFHPFF